MEKPIVRDIFFLGRKSVAATASDRQIIEDLQDTLRANQDRCVGMAANMIGYLKRMIIVNIGFANVVMINPRIVERHEPYEAEEGCLSLTGTRRTTRYRQITVVWQDTQFAEHRNEYSGYVAQIIQHECDHLEGIII